MGGAKNCPETPRQKMIGMMYLVLTAMLALNVSAEILNGFNKLRQSMESTIKSTDNRTEDLMRIFSAAYQKDEGSMKKYGDWWEIAKANKKMSDEFYNYIEQFKMDIVRMEEGEEVTEFPKELKASDDTNKPHQYAINEKDPNTGRTHAAELRSRMDAYRQYMTSADSECIQAKMRDASFRHEWEQKVEMYNSLFSTGTTTNKEGQIIPWEQAIFEEMPAGAVYAMLTKYQSDIRLAENDFLNFLFKSAGSSDFVINSVQALIIPDNGDYVMQGTHYRARIVSAAVDTTNLPLVYINGQEYKNGVYDLVANQVGPHTYNGYMLMPGDTTRYTFKGQYTVGAPSFSMSNLDINILYRNYDNKFRIAVPGVKDDKISVSAKGATISRKDGLYIFKPTEKADSATISISAEIEGKMMQIGFNKYKIKPLPPAQIFFTSAGVTYTDPDVAISYNAFRKGNPHLEASYGADGVLDLSFKITSFSIYTKKGLRTSFSDKFTNEMINDIGGLNSGDDITVMSIKYQEPGGAESKSRNNLILKLK